MTLLAPPRVIITPELFVELFNCFPQVKFKKGYETIILYSLKLSTVRHARFLEARCLKFFSFFPVILASYRNSLSLRSCI